MQRLKQLFTSQRGAVLVFMSLMMIIFVIFMGLIVDTGWMTFVRNQGQTRVDSAQHR